MDAKPNDSLLLKPKEARDALRIGNTKFWELVRAGTIETVKIGRSTRVKRSSLRRVADTGAA